MISGTTILFSLLFGLILQLAADLPPHAQEPPLAPDVCQSEIQCP